MRESDRVLLAIEALRAEVRAELAEVRALLTPKRPTAAGDGRLLFALAAAIGSREFSAGEVFAHAATDPALARALAAALLDSPQHLGKCLQRLAGRPGALVVTRGPGRRAGVRWRILPGRDDVTMDPHIVTRA